MALYYPGLSFSLQSNLWLASMGLKDLRDAKDWMAEVLQMGR